MHMWPHQRWLEFVLSQLPLPQFQLLVSILHMKLKHLPPYWFIFMTHIYNGYFTKKKVWERALPTLSLSTQGWFSAAAAAGSCWGCKCGAENLAQCLLPFWGTHHLMKLTTSHTHKRLFQTRLTGIATVVELWGLRKNLHLWSTPVWERYDFLPTWGLSA